MTHSRLYLVALMGTCFLDGSYAGTVVITSTASGFTTRPGGTVTVTINP